MSLGEGDLLTVYSHLKARAARDRDLRAVLDRHGNAAIYAVWEAGDDPRVVSAKRIEQLLREAAR